MIGRLDGEGDMDRTRPFAQDGFSIFGHFLDTPGSRPHAERWAAVIEGWSPQRVEIKRANTEETGEDRGKGDSDEDTHAHH